MFSFWKSSESFVPTDEYMGFLPSIKGKDLQDKSINADDEHGEQDDDSDDDDFFGDAGIGEVMAEDDAPSEITSMKPSARYDVVYYECHIYSSVWQ